MIEKKKGKMMMKKMIKNHEKMMKKMKREVRKEKFSVEKEENEENMCIADVRPARHCQRELGWHLEL